MNAQDNPQSVNAVPEAAVAEGGSLLDSILSKSRLDRSDDEKILRLFMYFGVLNLPYG
jgi:hypothetical protein